MAYPLCNTVSDQRRMMLVTALSVQNGLFPTECHRTHYSRTIANGRAAIRPIAPEPPPTAWTLREH